MSSQYLLCRLRGKPAVFALSWKKLVSTEPSGISDMIATVKSREVQRAMLAEMAGDQNVAIRHFLAAAHLELVLAENHAADSTIDLALRSHLSAASCFWRASHIAEAQAVFDALLEAHPAQGAVIQQVITELKQDYPSLAC